MNQPKNAEIFRLLKLGYDVELSVVEDKAFVTVTSRDATRINLPDSYPLGKITNQRPALQSQLTRHLRALLKRLTDAK